MPSNSYTTEFFIAYVKCLNMKIGSYPYQPSTVAVQTH